MFWLKSKKVVATHSGNFHADDVFAVATLSILHKGKIKIVRTRDKEIYSQADYILDVGQEYDPVQNKFDHHQEGGAGKRENGIPYSSLGLVWKKFGEQVSGSQEVVEIIDKKFVQVIDADDNGFEIYDSLISEVKPYTISDYVVYISSTTKKENRDKAFKKLVKFAINLIKIEINISEYILNGRQAIQTAYNLASDKRLIILEDKEIEGRADVLADYPEPLYVIKYSKTDDSWKIYTIRDKGEKFKNRLDLPESWGSKKDEALARETGVADALYCHHNLYMAIAKSKEGAIALAKLALKNAK